ncbi:MAG TPA: hypothetical protein VHM90_01160, partial [Phycisphaerae bacterium]|nr:hypothetical protein [Phycisphaerae bacterium]
LKLMNRGYTAESYLGLIERAKRIVPGIQLAGDFIVGFPTETDEDYVRTRELVEKVRYKNCFIFKYSPRPGTVAIKRHEDDVPEEVKRHRNNDLLRVQNRISNELNRELQGEVVEVLCDGPSGWGSNAGGDREPDSVVAGKSCSSDNNVQLGASLAAGLKRKLDRHGNPFVAPRAPTVPADWVQLSGRTTHDQIVVFQGPLSLTGRIIPVRVREAHGMTIFADTLSGESTGATAECGAGKSL